MKTSKVSPQASVRRKGFLRFIMGLMNFDGIVQSMPQALNKPAQGCRACEATLGTRARSAQP
jgi:hypothetical protein